MSTFLEYLALARAGKSDQIKDPEARDLAIKSLALVREGDKSAADETARVDAQKKEVVMEQKRGILRTIGVALGVCESKDSGTIAPSPPTPAPQEPKYTPPPIPAGAGPTGSAFPNTFSAVAEAAASLKVDQAALGVAMVTHGDEGPAAVLAAVYAKAAEANKAVPPSSQTNGPSGSGLSQEEDSLLTSIKAVAAQHAPKHV